MLSNSFFYRKIFFCLLVLILSCFCLGGLECHYDDDDDDYDHYVSRPDRPDGPLTARVDQEVTFETGGSYCYEGHSVEYRFDFGDSEQSGWSKEKEQDHSYKKTGAYRVSAQARCSVSLVTSSWSDSSNIYIDDRIEICSLWQDEEGQIWTVANKGRLLRYSSGQKKKEEKITEFDLYGIWGSKEILFCCGEKGTLLGHEKNIWKKYSLPTAKTLYRLSGIGEKCFAVGEKGTILHFDGESWKQVPSPTQESLYGVWVHQENSVFAVGANSTILYYDGEIWKKCDVQHKENIYTIWGSDYTNVWAAGQKGILLHFNGNAWKRIYYTEPLEWKSICGFDSKIYIASKRGSVLSIHQEKIEKIVFQRNTGIEAMLPLKGYKRFCTLNAKREWEEFFLEE